MDESKYTDGFIWSVGPVFNSSEKRLARTLLLLANFGKERRPEPMDRSIDPLTKMHFGHSTQLFFAIVFAIFSTPEGVWSTSGTPARAEG
jgi:hypothetical protein